jgi:hypothetical protein
LRSLRSPILASTLVRVTGTETPPANSATTTAGTADAPKSETLTKEQAEAMFDARFKEYREKVNGELASHRKKAEPAKDPTPATVEDIKLSREVGRLEAQLGPEVLATLGEEYESASVSEQARMLRLASKLNAHKPAAETAGQSSRGETPVATSNARGIAPSPRSTARPASQTAFAQLKRSDPSAASELLRDPAFDLASLPWK